MVKNPHVDRREQFLYLGAGDYRHPATVLKPSTSGTVDSYGKFTPNSTASFSARIRAEPLYGEDAAYARTQYPQARYRVWMRYDSRINEECRMVLSNGSTLHVYGINENFENRELILTCGEER